MSPIKVKKFFTRTPFEVSWVGECPWTKARCFGDEDGRLFFESPGRPEIGDGLTVCTTLATEKFGPIATDPINDVAFAGDRFAASSRNEVVVGLRHGPGVARLDRCDHEFIGGAHGVVASRSGTFLAPIADQGFLMLKLEGDRVDVRIGSPPGAPFNFYRMVCLGSGLNDEAFAAAGRRDGLMAIDFAHGSPTGQMFHHRFEGHDIVDVCPLNHPNFPFVVACVSRDRAIFFIRNVLEEQPPSTVSLAGVRGTAYTLLSAQGHLFLLTDRELIIMPDLAAQFLRGETFGPEIAISTIRVDASEAFLLRDESILLIEGDSIVSKIDIPEMVGTSAEKHSDGESAWNGWADQGGRVEVPCDPRRVSVIPTEFGWQTGAESVMITSPAA